MEGINPEKLFLSMKLSLLTAFLRALSVLGVKRYQKDYFSLTFLNARLVGEVIGGRGKVKSCPCGQVPRDIPKHLLTKLVEISQKELH